MKILLLDIESAPNLVHVWGLWQQNVHISQIMDASYILCWSAKWLGEEEIFFGSVQRSKPKTMLKKIHKLLEEADAVIHYNGSRFDIPTLNKEFLLHGLLPPASYKQIDLLNTARNRFRFPSNKLDFIAKSLGVGEKHKHAGHELWVKCMAGDEEAWKEMEEYNKNDVILLEEVYFKFRPWIKGHPNMGVYTDNDEPVCPHCGSAHLHRRGYSYTSTGRYPRFQCQSCGTWSRGRKSDTSSVEVVTERV